MTGPPFIRFYAGAPLITDQGNALGTVCVMDHRPRRLDDAQRQSLHTLAAHAVTLIELHGRAHQAEEVVQRLRALEKLKTQFLRNINHELRTPLASIRSYLELVRDGGLDEATEQRFLEVIERNGDRMLQLGNTLLQVLDNAIKFTSRGGAIDVVVVAGPPPEVEIHDTGVGVESEDLRRVFEEFYRTPQAEQRAVEGTGIGLSIVEKIMEMHGGTARMEKGRHEGVCVYLALPPSAVAGDRPVADSGTT